MSEDGRAACATALLLSAALAACSTASAPLPASRITPIEGPRDRTMLVLDLESTDRDPAEIDRLLADTATNVAMISRPDGAIWKRIRASAARLRVAIVEACAGGRSDACSREAARFVAAWRDAPGPPTGTV